MVAGLLGAGWAVGSGSRHRVESGPGVRLTVSTLSVAEVPALADAVAGAVRPSGGGLRV